MHSNMRLAGFPPGFSLRFFRQQPQRSIPIGTYHNLSKLKPKTQENIKTLTDLHDDSSCSYFLHAHVIHWCHCTEGYLLGYQASDVKRTPFGIVPRRSN